MTNWKKSRRSENYSCRNARSILKSSLDGLPLFASMELAEGDRFFLYSVQAVESNRSGASIDKDREKKSRVGKSLIGCFLPFLSSELRLKGWIQQQNYDKNKVNFNTNASDPKTWLDSFYFIGVKSSRDVSFDEPTQIAMQNQFCNRWH